MMLRWIERSEPAPELGEGIGRMVRVLQVGYSEVARTQDNGAGGTVNVMEFRWYDVPFEPNP